ncbi:MarR family winged helix-turn-helix transcriptional regulator [Agromyces sp. PvR057]|uniref:MarR family winged helix-turn-helix transcriptional regulator n=1 Tax=Agromyces sp. PvR057 TaxID=3156403 RepID=UPI003399630F
MSPEPKALPAPGGPLGDHLTVTLHLLVDRMDRFADALLRARFGISFNQFQFVAVIADLPTPPDITTLADCLGVSKAAVSKRVPSFVEAGLVQTSTDPANARRVLLSITPQAGRLLSEALPVLGASFTDEFDDLDTVDLDALHDDLKAVIRHLDSKEH